MKISEIRALDLEEINKALEESSRELLGLRFRTATRQLTNYREINAVKKKIARLKTVVRERELGITPGAE